MRTLLNTHQRVLYPYRYRCWLMYCLTTVLLGAMVQGATVLAVPVTQSSVRFPSVDAVDVMLLLSQRNESDVSNLHVALDPMRGEEKRLLKEILYKSKTTFRYGKVDLEAIESQKNVIRPDKKLLNQGSRVPERIENNAMFLPEKINTRLGIDSTYRLGIYGKDLYVIDKETNHIKQVLYDYFD